MTQLEDDRFSRMEHFYGADDIDVETLEDLDLGDDGKVSSNTSSSSTHEPTFLFDRLATMQKICSFPIEKNSIRPLILTKANTRQYSRDLSFSGHRHSLSSLI